MGVTQDYIKANYWFLKAAEGGSSEGQYELGMAYAKGLGVHQNYAAAYFWMSLSPQGNHEMLNRLAKKIPDDEIKKIRIKIEKWKKQNYSDFK